MLATTIDVPIIKITFLFYSRSLLIENVWDPAFSTPRISQRPRHPEFSRDTGTLRFHTPHFPETPAPRHPVTPASRTQAPRPRVSQITVCSPGFFFFYLCPYVFLSHTPVIHIHTMMCDRMFFFNKNSGERAKSWLEILSLPRNK